MKRKTNIDVLLEIFFEADLQSDDTIEGDNDD